jgi:hypothetical protein
VHGRDGACTARKGRTQVRGGYRWVEKEVRTAAEGGTHDREKERTG